MMSLESSSKLIQDIVTIWVDAQNPQSPVSPSNRITAIREISLSLSGPIVTAKRFEFQTGNGSVFRFYFDIEDRDLQLAMFQEFSIGSGMSEAICMEAHLKMLESSIPHSIYLDPVHGSCINIIMSGKSALDVFKGSYWIELH